MRSTMRGTIRTTPCYVITGDVDGPSTIAAVKKYFSAFPAAKLPARTGRASAAAEV